MRDRLLFAGAVALVILILQLPYPVTTDPDGFYHLGHARIFWETGPFNNAFPWTQFSVIRTEGADLWWGLHVLLMPAALLPQGQAQFIAANLTLTILGLLALAEAGRILRVPNPYIWPLVLYVSSYSAMWRFSMIRPHVLSVGLMLLCVALIFRGRLRHVFLVALAVGYVHQTLSWLLIPLAATAAVGLLFAYGKGHLRHAVLALLAVIAGVGIAWIARPNPAGALDLMQIQILEIARIRAAGVELHFGSEVFPRPLDRAFGNALGLCLLVGIALLAGLILGVKRQLKPTRPETVELLYALGLAALFLSAIPLATQRTIDQAYGAVTLVGMLAFRQCAKAFPANWHIAWWPLPVALALSIQAYPSHVYFLRNQAYPIYEYRNAMQTAQRSIPPGTRIFHSLWSQFPPLFYWNSQNLYIGGMDPVFQYKYDPALYTYMTSIAKGDTLLGTTPTGTESLLTYVPRHFGTRYYSIAKRTNPNLFKILLVHPKVTVLYADARVALVEINPQ